MTEAEWLGLAGDTTPTPEEMALMCPVLERTREDWRLLGYPQGPPAYARQDEPEACDR